MVKAMFQTIRLGVRKQQLLYAVSVWRSVLCHRFQVASTVTIRAFHAVNDACRKLLFSGHCVSHSLKYPRSGLLVAYNQVS